MEVNYIKEISADKLKKIVKLAGDGCVTGYTRFKKVKPILGYKKAQDWADRHLSRIDKARINEDGTYVVVMRFEWVWLLIPIVMLALLAFLLVHNAKAMEPIPTTDSEIEVSNTMEQVTHSESSNDYISIPGYTDLTISEEFQRLIVYNPTDNDCRLVYKAYVEDRCLWETRALDAGEDEEVDIYNNMQSGQYTIKLVAEAYAVPNNAKLNSVSQTINVKVEG